jgi:hypothetical protein
MVRELEIIFHLDTIPGELGVTRHALVFLEQLGGISPLAIVLPVARLPATEALAPPLSTTAPAAALTIVDQIPTSLRSDLSPFASDGQGDACMRQL